MTEFEVQSGEKEVALVVDLSGQFGAMAEACILTIEDRWRTGSQVTALFDSDMATTAKALPVHWNKISRDEIYLEAGLYKRASSSSTDRRICALALSTILGAPAYLVVRDNFLLNSNLAYERLRFSGKLAYELDWESSGSKLRELRAMEVLGFGDAQYVGFRESQQVFVASHIDQMGRHISERYGEDWLSFLSELPEQGGVGWSEFGLYGAFCFHALDGGIHAYLTQNTVSACPIHGEAEEHSPSTWIQAGQECGPKCARLGEFEPANGLSAPLALPSARMRSRETARAWPIGDPPSPREFSNSLECCVPEVHSDLGGLADLIVVVNLRDSRDRLDFQIAQASRLGFPFYRYPAISGAELSAHSIPESMVGSATAERLLAANPGGLGHGLTFIELLRVAADLAPGERMWILEDDAEIDVPSVSHLVAALDELPRDWDVVTLGARPWHLPSVLFSWDDRGSGNCEKAGRSLVAPKGGLQTVSWMLTSRGANALLDRVLPWHDFADYVAYRAFLRRHDFTQDYPTPGSFDIALQMHFCDLEVFHVHADGGSVIRETMKFPSTICELGRGLD